jgi:hypothetical protein
VQVQVNSRAQGPQKLTGLNFSIYQPRCRWQHAGGDKDVEEYYAKHIRQKVSAVELPRSTGSMLGRLASGVSFSFTTPTRSGGSSRSPQTSSNSLRAQPSLRAPSASVRGARTFRLRLRLPAGEK